MILKKIRASNLKGQTFDLELGVGTAIVGPNATGKTAIIEAIRFICRGKFPEIKKGSWPEMTVVGTFDRGTISRSINAKGTVSTDAADETADLDMDIPLLDPEHYFGLTDRERTNYVFERVKLPADYTAEGLIAEMQRLSLGEEHTEDVEKARADLISEIRGIFTDPSFTLQEAIAIAVDNLRVRYTYWNRRCKETLGAVTTLTELKLREREVRATPTTLQADIESARKASEEIQHELGGLRQKAKAAEMAIANRKSIEKYLNEPTIDYNRMIEQAREKRQTLAHEFELLNDSLMSIDYQGLQRELRAAEIDCKKSGEAAAIFDDTCAELSRALEDLEKQKACPYCTSDVEGWKDKARFKLKSKLRTAQNTYKAQIGIAQKEEARVKDLKARIASYESGRGQADKLRADLKTLGDAIDRHTDAKEREAKQREQWKEQLASLAPAPPDTEAISSMESKLNIAKARCSDLEKLQTAETKLKHDLVRASEAAHENTVAEAQLLVTKKVARLLEAKRNEMVMRVFESLFNVANVFTQGILKSPLTMVDGVIGRLGESGKPIEHHWFSGTEKALAYIAIAIALSSTAPFKLVLLDEFGRLDEENQIKVIRRLDAMRKDAVIDQYIVAGTSLPKGIREGYSLPPGPRVLKIISVQ
jgi:chromosome segregation ATPase